MSARGSVAPKMKCPGCGKVVAYSDDAAGERWLRPHGGCTARRHLGNAALYYNLWKTKGLLPPFGQEKPR